MISLHIELRAIRSFFSAVLATSDLEYSKIHDRSEAGVFAHYDDEANALFIPMKCEEIACKSTLGELNALLESKLQEIAIPAYHKKYPDILNQKWISDLLFKELIELIESYYKIKFNSIASYNETMEIRNKVNSFKHRNGFKHPLKDKCTVFPEKVELNRLDAFNSIDIVENFLKDLWSKTLKKQSA